MKKAQTALMLMVGSLLLTGCEIPDSLEDFVGWRSKFFLNVDESSLDSMLGPFLVFLMSFAVTISLIGVISNIKNDRPFWSGTYLSGVGVMLAITSIFVYLPLASGIGEKVLPASLTLDKVLESMHWELSANLSEIASAGLGITVTLLLPLISSFWQIVMLIASIVAIMGSIVGRSLKGVAFAYSQIFGWAIFLIMYDTFVSYVGQNYPSWDFAPVSIFMSLFYTAAVGVLILGCYIGIPWMAFYLTPEPNFDKSVERRSESERRGLGERTHSILDAAFAVPIPIPTDDADSSRRWRGRSESGVVEGDIIDEDVMEQYYLPSPGSREEDTSSVDPNDPSPNSFGPSNPNKPSTPPSPNEVLNNEPTESTETGRRSNDKRVGPTATTHNGLGSNGKKAPTSPHHTVKINYDDYNLPDLEVEPPKREKTYSKIAPKIETAAKLAQAVGALTGQPEVILAGHIAEGANRVAEDVFSQEHNKSGVVKKHIRGGVSRVMKDQLPYDISDYFLPDEYTERRDI